MPKFTDLFFASTGILFSITLEYDNPDYQGSMTFVGIIKGDYRVFKDFIYDSSDTAAYPPGDIDGFNYNSNNNWTNDDNMSDVESEVEYNLRDDTDDAFEQYFDPPIYVSFAIPVYLYPCKNEVIVAKEVDMVEKKKRNSWEDYAEDTYITYSDRVKKLLDDNVIGGYSMYASEFRIR